MAFNWDTCTSGRGRFKVPERQACAGEAIKLASQPKTKLTQTHQIVIYFVNDAVHEPNILIEYIYESRLTTDPR